MKMGTESSGEVGAECNTRSTKGDKRNIMAMRDMIVASSHVLSFITRGRYPVGI